jgi:hypothetical protein
LRCFYLTRTRALTETLVHVVSACRSNAPEEEKEKRARCHYRSAIVEGVNFDLGDDVYIRPVNNRDHLATFRIDCHYAFILLLEHS